MLFYLKNHAPSGTRKVNADAWARLRATRYTPSGTRKVNASHGRACARQGIVFLQKRLK